MSKWFEIGLDTNKLKQEADEATRILNSIGSGVKEVSLIPQIDTTKLKTDLSEIDKLVSGVLSKKGKSVVDMSVQFNLETIKKEAGEITEILNKLEKQSTQLKSETVSAIKTPTATVQDVTEAIDAQAMAYRDLDKIVGDILGTQDQNALALVRERSALADVQRQIATLTKAEKDRGNLTQTEMSRKAYLISEEAKHKQAISELGIAMRSSIKMQISATGSMEEMSQSLGRMRHAYRQLTEEERSSEYGQKLIEQIKSTDAEIKKLDASIGNHQRNVGNYGKFGANSFRVVSQEIRMMTGVFGNLPAPIQKVVTGLNGLTGASKAFIATPLGAIIAAIVVAIQSLRTWFDKSEKGQLAFAKASGVANSAMKALKDTVVTVGDALYDAFNNPKEAVKNLWNFIKSQFVNRIIGLGDVFKSLGKIISSGFTSGYDDLGKATAKVLSGTEDILGTLGKVNDQLKEGAKIGEQRHLIEKKLKDIEDQRLDLETNRTANADKLHKLDLEKVALLNQQIALEEKMDNKEKVRQLKSERNSLLNKGGSVDAKDYTAELEKNQRAIERAEKDFIFQQTQARINAMDEGLNKTLEANKLNHEKEIEQIKRQAEDRLLQIQEEEKRVWEAKGGKGKFSPTTTKLSDSDQLAFMGLMGYADANKVKADEQATTQAMKQVAEMSMNLSNVFVTAEKQKQDAIKKTYSDIREQLDLMLKGGTITKQQFDELSKQATEAEQKEQFNQILAGVSDFQTRLDEVNETWNEKIRQDAEINGGKLADVLRKGQSEAIGALNAEYLTKSDEWVMLFDNLEYLSVSRIMEIKKKIESQLNDLELDPASMKAVMDSLNKITQQVSRKNPFIGLKDAIKAYQQAGDEVAKSKALYDALNNVSAMAGQAQSIFGDIVNGLQAMGVSMDEETENMLAGIGDMIGGAAELAQGIASGNPASIIAGGIKLLTSAIDVFDSKSRRANRQIKENNEELDKLDRAYSRLTNTVNEFYASDRVQHVERMKQMKEAQRELIKSNIEAEKSKKKPNKSAIKEWENELENINDELKELGKSAQEAIMGFGVQQAIEDFASAYVDAWAAGEDKAASMKDVVKNMIKSSVKMLASKELKDSVTNLYNTIQEAMSDGFIDDYEANLIAKAEEQAYKRAEELEKSGLGKYLQGDSGNKQGSATYGEYKAITEERAGSIDGRLNSIQMTSITNTEHLKGIFVQTLSISDNLRTMQQTALDSWGELTEINKNTKLIKETNSRLDELHNTIKNKL